MRLRRIEPVLRRALAGPCRLPRGTTVLVAVSGGPDSTGLLLGLHRLSDEFGLHLNVAHLHHGLRGMDADADLAFVEALCARLGLMLHRARWNTRARMERRGLSGQAGLRSLRQEFLLAAARRAGAAAIATAHTADDQLETALMRLARGTGLHGLGGMRARRGPWIKPMLEATRVQIEADLRRMRQPWREDPSNRDPKYLRSRLRHEVVPALVRADQPGGDPTAGRARLALHAAHALAEVREARAAIGRMAARALPRVLEVRGDEFALDSRRLAAYPAAIRRALITLAWRRQGAQPGLTRRHVAGLMGLVAGKRGGARIALPGEFEATRSRGRLLIRPAAAAPERVKVRLAVPGRTDYNGGSVQGRWLSGDAARVRLSGKPTTDEFFAAEGLEGGLQVRTARADERFVPYGARSPVRLRRFLSKQPVPREVRSRPTVLADAGGILWVIGVRRSARAPLSQETRKALWVHVERHD